MKKKNKQKIQQYTHSDIGCVNIQTENQFPYILHTYISRKHTFTYTHASIDYQQTHRIMHCNSMYNRVRPDQLSMYIQYQNQLGTFLGICIIQVGIDRGIRNRSKREVIIIPRPAFPHECVLIAYHRETTYDIECHIGSDLSNNGRWRKDSGFDVSKPRTYHCNRIRRGEGSGIVGHACAFVVPPQGVSLSLSAIIFQTGPCMY